MKMNSEHIKKITNEAIEQLIEALNAGHSETLTQYLEAMAKFRAYSFSNVILILKQCPNASRVAGYRTWQSLGRQVRKGEKGILILAPMVRKRTEDADESSTDEAHRVIGFHSVYVWDESQTAGADLPRIGSVTGDPSVYLERLETFVRANGIALDYSVAIAPAKGMAEKEKITLLPDQTPAETFATLVHEQAHVMLHQSDRRAETSKRIRETEAEAVAFVVSKAIGLETATAAQDYLALYGADSKVLSESLDYVQRTASRILFAIELRPELQAAKPRLRPSPGFGRALFSV
jgi:antirestriction protein ArdC